MERKKEKRATMGKFNVYIKLVNKEKREKNKLEGRFKHCWLAWILQRLKKVKEKEEEKKIKIHIHMGSKKKRDREREVT